MENHSNDHTDECSEYFDQVVTCIDECRLMCDLVSNKLRESFIENYDDMCNRNFLNSSHILNILFPDYLDLYINGVLKRCKEILSDTSPDLDDEDYLSFWKLDRDKICLDKKNELSIHISPKNIDNFREDFLNKKIRVYDLSKINNSVDYITEKTGYDDNFVESTLKQMDIFDKVPYKKSGKDNFLDIFDEINSKEINDIKSNFSHRWTIFLNILFSCDKDENQYFSYFEPRSRRALTTIFPPHKQISEGMLPDGDDVDVSRAWGWSKSRVTGMSYVRMFYDLIDELLPEYVFDREIEYMERKNNNKKAKGIGKMSDWVTLFQLGKGKKKTSIASSKKPKFVSLFRFSKKKHAQQYDDEENYEQFYSQYDDVEQHDMSQEPQFSEHEQFQPQQSSEPSGSNVEKEMNDWLRRNIGNTTEPVPFEWTNDPDLLDQFATIAKQNFDEYRAMQALRIGMDLAKKQQESPDQSQKETSEEYENDPDTTSNTKSYSKKNLDNFLEKYKKDFDKTLEQISNSAHQNSKSLPYVDYSDGEEAFTQSLYQVLGGPEYSGETNRADQRLDFFLRNPDFIKENNALYQRVDKVMKEMGYEGVESLPINSKEFSRTETRAIRQALQDEGALEDSQEGASDGFLSQMRKLIEGGDEEAIKKMIGQARSLANFRLQEKNKDKAEKAQSVSQTGLEADEEGRAYEMDEGMQVERERSPGVEEMSEEERQETNEYVKSSVEPELEKVNIFSEDIINTVDAKAEEIADQVISGEKEPNRVTRNAVTLPDYTRANTEGSEQFVKEIIQPEYMVDANAKSQNLRTELKTLREDLEKKISQKGDDWENPQDPDIREKLEAYEKKRNNYEPLIDKLKEFDYIWTPNKNRDLKKQGFYNNYVALSNDLNNFQVSTPLDYVRSIYKNTYQRYEPIFAELRGEGLEPVGEKDEPVGGVEGLNDPQSIAQKYGEDPEFVESVMKKYKAFGEDKGKDLYEWMRDKLRIKGGDAIRTDMRGRAQGINKMLSEYSDQYDQGTIEMFKSFIPKPHKKYRKESYDAFGFIKYMEVSKAEDDTDGNAIAQSILKNMMEYEKNRNKGLRLKAYASVGTFYPVCTIFKLNGLKKKLEKFNSSSVKDIDDRINSIKKNLRWV